MCIRDSVVAVGRTRRLRTSSASRTKASPTRCANSTRGGFSGNNSRGRQRMLAPPRLLKMESPDAVVSTGTGALAAAIAWGVGSAAAIIYVAKHLRNDCRLRCRPRALRRSLERTVSSKLFRRLVVSQSRPSTVRRNPRPPVSYTHLDVYKRQGRASDCRLA